MDYPAARHADCHDQFCRNGAGRHVLGAHVGRNHSNQRFHRFRRLFCGDLYIQELHLRYQAIGHRGPVPHLHGDCVLDPGALYPERGQAGDYRNDVLQVLGHPCHRCPVVLADDD